MNNLPENWMTCKLLEEVIYATGFVEKITDWGARRWSVCSDLVTDCDPLQVI